MCFGRECKRVSGSHVSSTWCSIFVPNPSGVSLSSWASYLDELAVVWCLWVCRRKGFARKLMHIGRRHFTDFFFEFLDWKSSVCVIVCVLCWWMGSNKKNHNSRLVRWLAQIYFLFFAFGCFHYVDLRTMQPYRKFQWWPKWAQPGLFERCVSMFFCPKSILLILSFSQQDLNFTNSASVGALYLPRCLS